jgi:hypothetical protein
MSEGALDLTEEERLAAFSTLRASYQARYADLRARYPLPSAEEWLRRLDEASTGIEGTTPGWGIAFVLQVHPLGDELSGLVVAPRLPAPARLHWTSRSGLVAVSLVDEPSVTLDAGERALDAPSTRTLSAACHAAWASSLEDVPARCYDGTSFSLLLRRLESPNVRQAHCNVCDEGSEPTLVLARAVLRTLMPVAH